MDRKYCLLKPNPLGLLFLAQRRTKIVNTIPDNILKISNIYNLYPVLNRAGVSGGGV
jgi:hypothetical protein